MVIGVGYAFLNINLSIIGNTKINKTTWDVHFENLLITEGSVEATSVAEIDTSKTAVNFTVALATPGDFTVDAMINSIVNTYLRILNIVLISY